MNASSVSSVFRRAVLAAALLTSSLAIAQEEETSAGEPVEMEAVEIAADENSKAEHGYSDRETGTATGLSLSPRQTPQSVSTVTRERMDDFGLDSINEVLENTTGVTVEKVETDRTYYTSRGFDVTNFLRDGVGVPFVYHPNVLGDIDTAIYQEIEVLRGANGLIGGTGNPAATVNFIRKRPTQEFNATVGLTMGAWSRQRLDADIAGSLTDDGDTRGRLVAAYQDGDSWLDRYSQERSVFYGVVEQDLTDTTLLTLGHSHQNVNSDSPMWGALPLVDYDGSELEYDRSTSTSSDWSYWDNEISTTFAELKQELGAGWSVDLMLEHQETESDSELFYVYQSAAQADGSGSDLFAYPSAYEKQTTQQLADLRVKGPFEAFGRMHEVVTGVNYWEVELDDESNYGQGIGTEIVPLDEWNGRYPKPAFTAGTQGSDLLFREKSAFAATRISVLESLSVIGGAKVIAVDYNGETYGESRDTEYDAETVPYGGIVYDVNEVFSVYASHAETFSPQTETDADRDFLDPVEGTSQEVGIKAEIPGSGGALIGLAAFEVEQDNVAEQVGTINGEPVYEGRDGITSTGWELTAQGEVIEGLQLAGGYTHMNINNPDGSRAKPYVPEKMLRLSSVYQVPAVPALKVGASVNWQDDICRPGKTYCQDDYALVGLMGQYQLNERVKAQLNIYNVTDEKYINSLYWDQGYYGAPRHAELSLSWNW